MEGEVAEILKYYGAAGEVQRLQHGIARLEMARTQELLLRHLPSPPAVIYDIGGGAGAYSFWLAGMGYEVHLFDLSPVNVEAARAAAVAGSPTLAAIEVADGRSIPRPGGSADVTLVMGPLYHLTERAHRLDALREARRLLKPGGVLAASAITRYGSTLWGLSTYGASNWLLDDPAFRAMIEREMLDGQHFRPEGMPVFTRAFYHLPGELLQEAVDSGFPEGSVFAIEGPGWIVPQFEAIWEDEQRRAILLHIARTVEQEQALMAMSPHFMVLTKK